MKISLLLLFSIYSFSVLSMQICGGKDTRFSSHDDRIGRLDITGQGINPDTQEEEEVSTACTVFLISKSCAITAGHCLQLKRPKMVVNFKVPLSYRDGRKKSSNRFNQYKVDQRKSVFMHKRGRHDWAVLKLKKNRKSGKFPGSKYGYFPRSYEFFKPGEAVTVIGMGINSSRKQRKKYNYTQRSSEGEIVLANERALFILHNADTMSGSSGGPLINKRGEVIGVHTSGGCQQGSFNQGFLFASNLKVQEQIKTCLASE